jgi:hypothetical protein
MKRVPRRRQVVGSKAQPLLNRKGSGGNIPRACARSYARLAASYMSLVDLSEFAECS